MGQTARASGLGTLSELIFAEPLIGVGWDGHPVARLAESWTWTEDGKHLIARLRPDVLFHDGTKLTAGEVAGSLTEVLRARNADYFGGFEYVDSVEAVDDRTIRFRLSRLDSFLISELNNTRIIKRGTADVGTGPFRVLRRDSPAQFEAFTSYYRGVPQLRRISIQTYESLRGAWAALMRSEVDMVQDVTRDSVEFLERAPQIRTYSSIRPFYIPLIMNLRHPILRKVEVRRALSEAVDRAQIVEKALRGRGRPADDPIWPFHWAYSAAARRYSYNPSAAELRLDAAALPVRAASAGRMDSRFEFSCLFWSEDPEFERIALVLQRQLSAVGVDLTLKPVTLGDLRQRVARGDFDSYLVSVSSGRALDWTYRFWHSPHPDQPSLHDTGYASADPILERMRAARTDSDTRSAVADFQKQLYDDAPAIFLAWRESTRAVHANFTVAEATDPDILGNVWRWRPSADARAAR